MNIADIGAQIALYYIPFLFALCFHEYAHGLVAQWRGDNTARMMGRLTLNPVAHMDYIGTLALPLLAIIVPLPIFFGWAKPVPVNERNLKSPRTDMFWIALAGPLSNLLLAVVGCFLFSLIFLHFGTAEMKSSMLKVLNSFVLTNMFLAIFNLIPLNPLDGGKVLARFLPTEVNYKLEQNEQWTSLILLVLIASGALNFLQVVAYFSRDVLLNLFGAILT